MALDFTKRAYTDYSTVITADNLNAIQDAILTLGGRSDKAAPAIYESAEAAVVSITDGADGLPCKSVLAQISSETGVTKCTARRCGKNLLKKLFENRTHYGATFVANANGSVTISDVPTTNAFTPSTSTTDMMANGAFPLKAGTYTLKSLGVSGLTAELRFFAMSGESAGFVQATTSDRVFTRDEDGYAFPRIIATTDFDGEEVTVFPALYFRDNEPDAWQPYDGQDYTISWSDIGAVHDGSVDLVTGVLTDDNDQTHQLTPVEIDTLLGDNVLYADTGDVSVTYPADTKLYIDAQIAAVMAAMSEE